MRLVIHQPRLRHRLHPGARQRNELPPKKQLEIAILQGSKCNAQAARRRWRWDRRIVAKIRRVTIWHFSRQRIFGSRTDGARHEWILSMDATSRRKEA